MTDFAETIRARRAFIAESERRAVVYPTPSPRRWESQFAKGFEPPPGCAEPETLPICRDCRGSTLFPGVPCIECCDALDAELKIRQEIQCEETTLAMARTRALQAIGVSASDAWKAVKFPYDRIKEGLP